jgi:hypothetical protein
VRPHLDAAVVRCVAQRVVEQVRQHLPQPAGIGLDGAHRAAGGRNVMCAAARRLQPDHTSSAISSASHFLQFRPPAAGLQARQVEQIFDDVVQPVGVLVHDLEELPLHVRAAGRR